MNKIFNNLNINKNLYILLAVIAFGFTLLLNTTNQIASCAFIYVLLAVTSNFISEFYGIKRAMQTIIISSIGSAFLFWDINYYIHDIKVSILVGSFMAVIISVYWGVCLLEKIKSSYNFHVRNFIALLLASVVDSVVMAVVLANKLSMSKVASIFAKDIMFKFSYSLSVSLCMLLIVYAARHLKNIKSY
jgi:hypothetical protein